MTHSDTAATPALSTEKLSRERKRKAHLALTTEVTRPAGPTEDPAAE